MATPQASIAKIKLGIDTLEASQFKHLKGKRVGLITNPSGVNFKGKTTLEVLYESPDVDLVALFGPEHGVYGVVPAGDYVESHRDEKTGVWV
ncbi:MAG: exo-beta-N-acetylmuramidase NamZ domain-containing protein, partial [Verrucomicrobiota bacterium]